MAKMDKTVFTPYDRNPLTDARIEGADVFDNELNFRTLQDAPTPPEYRNVAEVRISTEMLERMLKLPGGHKIIGVMPVDLMDFAFPAFRVVVEGPQMPLSTRSHQMAQMSLWQNEDGTVEFKV